MGVFSPSHRNHYLNVTPNNLLKIYPPEPEGSFSQSLPSQQKVREGMVLLALEGQGCWDSPMVLLGCLDCWDPWEQLGRKGEAREGQRNPPVGLQQLISAGFCRSLPRLGYSWTTPHSPSGMSLPLGTGDDRGWAATAQSGLLGASPCTHRALGLGEKSQ